LIISSGTIYNLAFFVRSRLSVDLWFFRDKKEEEEKGDFKIK